MTGSSGSWFLLIGQANTLLACCYLCLAMAAWAFHRRVAWLSRAALALPFLLAWLQSLTPDGAEIRALRIWEEPSDGSRHVQGWLKVLRDSDPKKASGFLLV